MRELRKIPLKSVELSSSRPTIPEAVNALAQSIAESGLLNPILVTEAALYNAGVLDSGYRVIAGNHRVASARQLGWEEIDAFVVDAAGTLECELMEIDENLCRAELTAAQRAIAIGRRKEIWEALHPNNGRSLPENTRGRPREFAGDTEAATGEAKRTVNQHLSRAESLGPDIKEVIGTSLDKGVELDALKKLPPEERKELIGRAKEGEQISAKDYIEDEHARSVRLVKQAIAELFRCVKAMDAEAFGNVLDEIEFSDEVAEYASLIAERAGV